MKWTLPIFHMFIMSTFHKWTWAVIMAFAGGANMTYLNILNIALTVYLKGKLFFCICVVYITASK